MGHFVPEFYEASDLNFDLLALNGSQLFWSRGKCTPNLNFLCHPSSAVHNTVSYGLVALLLYV